ncbi:acetyl esterase [Prauserella marina]|uniref:Acetyl esterase n=1 Tax=Prauserella marina TaxID=530584 RepID=A0A1G6REJ5_9PSEU|nr:alpha/beta hydrolase [Prauserella marina]PWV77029.1 acetyl esterase [Prauserella marina]SDD02724.1 acetyl esterase [Prauserella marina]
MFDDEVDRMLAVLDSGFPAVQEMSGRAARAAVAARRPPKDGEVAALAATEDYTIDVEGGTIPARVYRPRGTQGRVLPGIVFFHGGGFVLCDIESHDDFCRLLAAGTASVVVSVGYRRAPEHRAPTAAEDALAGLRWTEANARRLGVDPAKLLTAGDSAGGNLAAVCCLLARDRDGPVIAGQLLIYPVIEPDFDNDSHRRFGKGHFNTTAAMRWYWRQYLGGDEHDALPRPEEYVAPSRAPRHAGLPPAVIVTAGRDPLCSEGRRYAETLRSAGIGVRHRHFPELFHGFFTIVALGAAEAARDMVWSDIRALTDNKEVPA